MSETEQAYYKKLSWLRHIAGEKNNQPNQHTTNMSTELNYSYPLAEGTISGLVYGNAKYDDDNKRYLPVNPELMELLEQKILEMIDNGYDLNQMDGHFCEELQSRPLQAIIEGIPNVSVEFVQKIIDKGADVNIYFCESDYYENFGAEDYIDGYWGIDILGNEMYAPLHLATMNNRIDLMQLLISAGADVNLKAGNDEKVPLDFAKTEETRKVLIDAGADESLAQD